jgi:hypothetical protein
MKPSQEITKLIKTASGEALYNGAGKVINPEVFEDAADKILELEMPMKRAAEELIAWYGPFDPSMHAPEINGAWLRLEAAVRRLA